MADFIKQDRRNRWTTTLTAGDATASLRVDEACNITIELTGGGSVSHSITDTGHELRATNADDAYNSKSKENTFVYTPGTSALITIDI